ncbi:MAG: DUF2062 domain-containing protein [Rhodocyclaceae bacterium]|nr:DUF2062 domain-containing protein [Rhodocyclaceae bacterium]
MRRQLRRFLPDHASIRENRWLAPFGNSLLHPRLWHLNRHSAAGGVAVGMFCGLIPGPFQMFGAVVCSVVFRVNLPVALLATLYTNPFTIVPLYLIAFGIGNLVVAGGGEFVAPPEFGTQGLVAWLKSLVDWTLALGKPLAVGLALLAFLLAVAGYAVVRIAWRIYLIRAWRARARRRTAT